MSNSTIVLRLENKLADFEAGNMSKYDFAKYLVGSIEALEGVEYTTILTAREFQYKFEVADFNDEDVTIESLEKVLNDFKSWLGTLK